MNRPDFFQNNRRKICLICEGFEEYDYISRLLTIGVWSDTYDFELVNAESNGNLSARYQDRYQSDEYDIVLLFCDTDRAPHKDFELIKRKINELFGKDTAAAEVIIFVNPCTIQINLLHFGETELRTQNKHKNAAEIERLTGVAGYNAQKEKRQAICSRMTKENYFAMKQRLRKISFNIADVPSSNFLQFISFFESSDDTWIENINKKLEE
jgi:hypothetical protein